MSARLKSYGSHVWDKPGLSGNLVSLAHLVRPNNRDRPNEQDRLADGGCLTEKMEAFRCVCSLGTQTGVT
jgi:hypothetical protein